MSDAKICDVCGEIIKKDYKHIQIENEYVNSLVPIVNVKHLDVCPKCWEKIERVLVKEQEHD